MATSVLPVQAGVPFQSFQAELDGRLYTLALVWNERISAWVLSLYDADGVALLLGRRLGLGCKVLPKRRTPTQPPGELLVVDVSAGGEPALADFGQDARCRLVYVDSADVPEGGPV